MCEKGTHRALRTPRTYRVTPLAEPHGEHGAEFAETRGSLSRPSTSEKHGIVLRFHIKGLIG
jgi:hypothetical protein